MGSQNRTPQPVGQEPSLEPREDSEQKVMNSHPATDGDVEVGAEGGVIREDWSEALRKFLADREGNPKTFIVGEDGEEGEGEAGADSESVSMEEEAEPMASENAPLKSENESADVQEEAEADTARSVQEIEENGDAGGEESAENGDGGEEAGSNAGVAEEEEKGVEVNSEEHAVEGSGEAPVEESSAEKLEALDAPVEEVVAEEEPNEELSQGEVVPSSVHGVEEKGVEMNLEEPAVEVSNEAPVEESSSEELLEGEALDALGKEVVAEAEPSEELPQVEAVTSSTDGVEERGMEVSSEASVPVEESAEKIESEALPVHEVEEVVTEAEPNEELSQVEAVASPTDAVEKEAIEVNSRDGSEATMEASPQAPPEEVQGNVDSEAVDVPSVDAATSAEPEEELASQKESNPKTSEEEPAEDIDASIAEETVKEAKPTETVDAHVEEVATSGDVEEKSLEVESGDVEEGDKEEASPGEALDDSVEEVGAPTSAEPVVEPAILESVSIPSDDVEEKVAEVNSEEATPDEVDGEVGDAHVEEFVEETSAEPTEEATKLEAVSAPSDNVQDESTEVNSEDGSKGVAIEEASSAEAAPEVESETVDAPVEGTRLEIEDAVTSAEPDVQSTSKEVETQMPAAETKEQSTTIPTSTPLPAEEGLFDLLEWESMNRTTSYNLQALPTEGVASDRGVETALAEDRSFQVKELPQESEAEPQSLSIPADAKVNEEEVTETPDAPSVTAEETLPEPPVVSRIEELVSVPIEHVPEEPSDALAEPCDQDPLTDELEHPAANAASIPAIIGSEAKELPAGTIKSVEDVSHLLQTVMTDEEVKAAAAAIHFPEENVEAGIQVLKPETVHAEPETSGAPQEKEVETVASKEFNLKDISEAPVTSEGDSGEHVLAPYLSPALAAASSGNEESGASKSYNLDEVATHLHDAAAKALQDTEASGVGEKQGFLAKNVAQIVLEESSNAKDSSEYISEVVQHVAQFAQDGGQSDPNVLPDTVARAFDGETISSPAANEVAQPKGTSLGNMVSLFVIWCVSLCASRVSSKDMPTPALKLAAEEVATIVHSNTPAQETATSSH